MARIVSKGTTKAVKLETPFEVNGDDQRPPFCVTAEEPAAGLKNGTFKRACRILTDVIELST